MKVVKILLYFFVKTAWVLEISESLMGLDLVNRIVQAQPLIMIHPVFLQKRNSCMTEALSFFFQYWQLSLSICPADNLDLHKVVKSQNIMVITFPAEGTILNSLGGTMSPLPRLQFRFWEIVIYPSFIDRNKARRRIYWVDVGRTRSVLAISFTFTIRPRNTATVSGIVRSLKQTTQRQIVAPKISGVFILLKDKWLIDLGIVLLSILQLSLHNCIRQTNRRTILKIEISPCKCMACSKIIP